MSHDYNHLIWFVKLANIHVSQTIPTFGPVTSSITPRFMKLNHVIVPCGVFECLYIIFVFFFLYGLFTNKFKFDAFMYYLLIFGHSPWLHIQPKLIMYKIHCRKFIEQYTQVQNKTRNLFLVSSYINISLKCLTFSEHLAS